MANDAERWVIVGAGGLGCPALLALLGAGARTFHIVDPDVVEASNLQRQVLYSVAHVGMPKVRAAGLALRARNPSIDLQLEHRGLRSAEVDSFVAALPPGSVVLECTDAPSLKFAFNDACLGHGVPLVIGAALGVRGQVLKVAAGQACYRCIYETVPREVPTCAAAGVLGPAVGLTGALMAQVALSRAPAGRLLALDLLRSHTQTLHPRPRPDCPACARAQPSLSSRRDPASVGA